MHLGDVQAGLAVQLGWNAFSTALRLFKVHFHTSRVSLVQRKLQELQTSQWPLPVASFKCCEMEITQNDLDTLLPGKWLNDQVLSTAYTCIILLIIYDTNSNYIENSDKNAGPMSSYGFCSGDQLLHETTHGELWPQGVHCEHILLHQTLCHWLRGCTEMAKKGDGLVHVHVCLTNFLQIAHMTLNVD